LYGFDAPDLICGVARIKPSDTKGETDEHAQLRQDPDFCNERSVEPSAFLALAASRTTPSSLDDLTFLLPSTNPSSAM
jgi:hypothetical protein